MPLTTSSSPRAWIPLTMTLLCAILATAIGVAFGREGLFFSVVGMPFPLYLLFLSRNLETPAEAYATEQRSGEPVSQPRDVVREVPTRAAA